MSEVDLGLRLFLNDAATPGLMGFASALLSMSGIIGGLIPQSGAFALAQDTLTAKMQAQAAAISEENYALFENVAAEEAVIAASEERMALLIAEQTALSDEATELLIAAGARTEYDALLVGEQEIQLKANENLAAYNLQLDENGTKINALIGEQAAYAAQLDATNASTLAAKSAQEALNAQVGLSVGVLGGSAIDLLAFGGGLKTVTDDAMGLQTAISIMSVAVQGSGSDISKLNDLLISLANNSIYSTTELAYGFQLLGERGYTASQIIDGNMGPAMTHLAEAIGATGQQGVTGAAGLLATALELFHAKASDATHYADLLTYAFYNGIPATDQLRSALEAVGGRAQLLGIPLDQVIVSLDALARAGMQGSQAGASLNYMLTALSSPIPKAQSELAYLGLLVVDKTTPAFKKFTAQLDAAASKAGQVAPKFDGSVTSLDNMFKAAQNLGIVNLDAPFTQWAVSLGILNSKFYDSKGHFIGLTEALHLLGTRLQDMNPEEKAQALSALFNVKSGQGATQLINNLIGVDKATTNLKKNSPGLALTDSEKITSTAAAGWKQFQTTLQDFAARIGMPILGPLTALMHGVNDFVGNLTLHNPQVIQFGLAFLLAGTLLSIAGVIIGVVMAGIAVASIPVVAAMLPIIGTVLLVAAGIALLAGLVAGLVIIFQHPPAAIKPLVDSLKSIGSAIGGVLGPMVKEIGADFGTLMKNGMPLVHMFAGQMQPVIRSLTQTFNDLKPGIVIVASIIGGIVLIAFRTLAGLIGGVLPGLFLILSGVIRIIVGTFQLMIGVITFLVSGLYALFLVMTGHPGQAGAVMQAAFHNLVQGIRNILVGLMQIVVGIFAGITMGVFGMVSGLVLGVISFFKHLFDQLVGHSIIPDLAKSILTHMIQMGVSVLSSIGSFISNMVAFFIHLGFSVLVAVGTFELSVLSKFQSFITGVVNLFKNLPNMIISAISSLGSMLLNAGMNAMNMLGNGIRNGISNVMGVVGNVASSIKNVLGFASPPKEGPLTDSDTYMPNMMKMYAGHIVSHTPLLQSAMHGAASGLAFSSPGVQSALNTSALNRSASGGVGGTNPTTTVNINMDGKCVTQVVMDRITGALQMNGVNRTLR